MVPVDFLRMHDLELRRAASTYNALLSGRSNFLGGRDTRVIRPLATCRRSGVHEGPLDLLLRRVACVSPSRGNSGLRTTAAPTSTTVTSSIGPRRFDPLSAGTGLKFCASANQSRMLGCAIAAPPAPVPSSRLRC